MDEDCRRVESLLTSCNRSDSMSSKSSSSSSQTKSDSATLSSVLGSIVVSCGELDDEVELDDLVERECEVVEAKDGTTLGTLSCSGQDGTAGRFLWRDGASRAVGAGSVVGPSRGSPGWAAAARLLEFFLNFHPALAACDLMARVDVGCGDSPNVMKFSMPCRGCPGPCCWDMTLQCHQHEPTAGACVMQRRKVRRVAKIS